MPLVRVEVRNEYGLGMPELYTETDREDPKAVLDGVAVAGLVGILRQLGDLAEFAAEVFHGLQEQVLVTSSRSHKLVERVHNIEAALPPLEKAILAQRSHLHFAYTAGSHWHTRLRTEQNHFIYSDLPRCIMDSYEDCRDPPRLHKLDKFDIGGPGSCFKRYSDPNYFKRTSAGPYEAHLQSVPREKKARRNKKKRSSSRYKDAPHGAPKTLHAERTDFSFSNFEEKSPPSQNISTFNVPAESGIEPENVDCLTSFDSRNGSGYIDCIFRPSYSTQSEDNNHKEIPSDLNQQQNSINSYLEPAYENNNYLAENSNANSPYITWDEKLEIIDSANQPNDDIQIPCKTEKIETEDLNGGLNEGLNESVNRGLNESLNEGLNENRGLNESLNRGLNESLNRGLNESVDRGLKEGLSNSVVGGAQPDEIESETDYYMDALNTIESESETDPDCHTKKELNQYSKVSNNDLFEKSTNFEFDVPEPSSESHVEAFNENYEGLTKSTQVVENNVVEPSLQVAADVDAVFNTTPEVVNTEKANLEKVNTEKFNLEKVNSEKVMFWTNGGLLGLEPSKPPDFGLKPEPVEETETKINLTENSKSESSEKPRVDNNTKTNEESDNNNSSRIFEFSNRLLVNGFRKQVSLVGNEQLASSVKSEVNENTSFQKGHRTFTGIPFREQFGNVNSFISPSSPPLEHMRISFQPIDGFKTSKLKLSFPDNSNNNLNNNNNNNGNSGHMFPSFQLVPEQTLLHESESDSDDDTFCRSSPYNSDDYCNNHSDSNSDQWDSSDSPRNNNNNDNNNNNNNHELDDAFGRISSAESVSSSLVNGIRFQQGFHDPVKYGKQSSLLENENESEKGGVLFDIPSFESVNGNYMAELCLPKEPTPPPPPLPPMEWRSGKADSSVVEKEDGLSERLTFALNLTPQQPILAPKRQERIVENKQPDWQNLHVQNEFNRTTSAKVSDEKEDFLQQIRTKSRNLRRTSTARPAVTPAGPTGVKVTAILEKASAIRQAVGSDGEDDNWSDT